MCIIDIVNLYFQNHNLPARHKHYCLLGTGRGGAVPSILCEMFNYLYQGHKISVSILFNHW